MKNTNLLFIMHYPPPIHGAAMVGQYIRESKLLNSSFNCKYINLSTSTTVDEIGKANLEKWLRYVGMIKALVGNLISFKPRLVYITLTAAGMGFYKDALLVLIARLWGKRILIHFHNKGVRTRQHKTLDNLLYKLVFKNSKVILLAPQLYSDIENYVRPHNVHYCSNGIPAIDYPSKLHVKKNTPQLLFLSNLIASKGVFTLLEACSLLQSKEIDFTCCFVGGEGDVTAQELQSKITALQLDGVVTYEGKKYGTPKYDVYAASDIFILPTYYTNECFPLVLLEAMQFSLPLVATNEGGIPNIIENGTNGFMVAPRDPEALAQKLELLLKEPVLRTKMGSNAHEIFKNKFTLEQFEHRFLSIISEETQ